MFHSLGISWANGDFSGTLVRRDLYRRAHPPILLQLLSTFDAANRCSSSFVPSRRPDYLHATSCAPYSARPRKTITLCIRIGLRKCLYERRAQVSTPRRPRSRSVTSTSPSPPMIRASLWRRGAYSAPRCWKCSAHSNPRPGGLLRPALGSLRTARRPAYWPLSLSFSPHGRRVYSSLCTETLPPASH